MQLSQIMFKLSNAKDLFHLSSTATCHSYNGENLPKQSAILLWIWHYWSPWSQA